MITGLQVLAELFDNMPLGIVVIDPAGDVVVYNRAEERLASRKREAVVGKSFFREIAPCMNVKELGGTFADKIGREAFDVDVDFSFPFPFMDQPRDVRVKLRSFDVAGVPHGFLLIEDISLQRSLDRMKETLQNLIVHDLKNPLTAISANLGYLEEVPSLRDNVDAAEAVRDSIRAAARLHGMLLNLLDVTRLETSTMPVHRREVDLGALLAEVAADNRAGADAHDATIAIDLSETVSRVSLDHGLIRRAIDNLVENAIRHAKHVVLHARIEGHQAIFEVRDDGPGIPIELRESIFEKYVTSPGREGSSLSHNRGLGLTFVMLAAQAHGGTASVACPVEGGTIFQVTVALGRGRVSVFV